MNKPDPFRAKLLRDRMSGGRRIEQKIQLYCCSPSNRMILGSVRLSLVKTSTPVSINRGLD
jgi:hypothetical protein